MKNTTKYTFFLIIILGFSGNARGDGKVFFVEGVPTHIPYQRAFLAFHDGLETLILQSKYEISQSEKTGSLGWVVPVPAVPEIASADADAAKIFFFFVSMHARPKITRISSFIFPITTLLSLGCIAFLLVLLLEYPFRNKLKLSKKVLWQRRLRKVLFITLIAFIFMTLTVPHLGMTRDIEVIKAQKAGIYDIKVIRGESADTVLDWLNENNFSFNETDKQMFEDYIEREWCFVVAKVEPELETEEHKIVSGGMVAPLILKFETDSAIYPLALTSTIGTDTEVLLYTLSDKKLSCNERLTLRNAKNTNLKDTSKYLLMGMEQEESTLLSSIPDKSMFLCKFKKKLKPEEMKKDIVFEFAPDNDSYTEKKIVW